MTGRLRKPPEPVIREAEMTGPGIPTTALYRFFDATRNLLYVGISDNLAVRFEWHRENQSWWGDVASKTIAWYGTRDKALAAEDYAIKTEFPQHNHQGQLTPGERSRIGHRPIRWEEGECEFFSDAGLGNERPVTRRNRSSPGAIGKQGYTLLP